MEYLSAGDPKRKTNVPGDAEIAVKLEVSQEGLGSLKKQVNFFIYRLYSMLLN